MNKQDFTQLVSEHLTDHFMQLDLVKDKEVDYYGTMKVRGFFEKKINTLRVAIEAEGWFEILVHEYCHFLQYIGKSEYEIAYYAEERRWCAWVMKELELTEFELDKEFRITRDLEIDCEKRVIILSRTLELPIDVYKYAKSASAYLYSYAFSKKNRIWCTESPDKFPEILELMPSLLWANDKEYDTMPDGYEELVKKLCL